MAKERDVNSRGIQGNSPGAESAKMPDGFLASVNELTAPGGFLGQPTSGKSRQDIPGSQEIDPREQYDFQSGGEPGLLGQDTDDYGGGAGGGGTRDDAERPSLPNVSLDGASGTTNMGPQGSPVDWDSVAPYRYPEFPADSIHVGGDPSDPRNA